MRKTGQALMFALLLFSSPVSVVHASDLYTEAIGRYREGDYEAAISKLREFVAADPRSVSAPYALYLLGDTLVALDLRAEAVDAFAQAVERYPSSKWATSAAHRLAEIHTSRDDWEKAIDGYARFVELYLQNHGGTVAGPVVSEALERIMHCAERLDPGRSEIEIQKGLIERFEDHPLADAIVFAAGGRVLPPGSNLVRNPGFELDREAMRLPPVGWEYLGTDPQPWDDADGTFDHTAFGGVAEPRSGRFCAGKFTSYGTHQGWLIQAVPVDRGKRYECAAFCLVKGTAEAAGTVRFGVDPRGGKDPHAASVAWTEYVSPRDEYEQIGFVGKRAIAAISGALTLFLEFRQNAPLPDNVMLFDDVRVQALDRDDG
jgi:hypothetical protein